MRFHRLIAVKKALLALSVAWLVCIFAYAVFPDWFPLPISTYRTVAMRTAMLMVAVFLFFILVPRGDRVVYPDVEYKRLGGICIVFMIPFTCVPPHVVGLDIATMLALSSLTTLCVLWIASILMTKKSVQHGSEDRR